MIQGLQVRWMHNFDENKTTAPGHNNNHNILDKYKNMSLGEYLKEDESKFLEFKSSMLWDTGKQRCSDNKFLVLQVIMAIQSFLNSDGGILLVGVNPDKEIVGIQNDFNCLNKDKNFDGWSMYLTCKIRNWLDNLVFDSISVTQVKHNGFIVAKITIEKHYKPVYIRYPDERGQRRVEFYIRGINGKEQLDTTQIHDYIKNHWYDSEQQENKEERVNKRSKLTEHCIKLRGEFLTHYSDVYDQPQVMPQMICPPPEGFFTRMMRTFRFREQFMAHLYTGYRDVYSSLKDAEEAEKSTLKLVAELLEKIQQKIRAQFRNEISFQPDVKEGHPTLDDRGVIWHITEEIDLDKWEGFKAELEASSRYILSQNQRYYLHNSDKELTYKLALKLTEIVNDSAIRSEVSNYRTVRKEREQKSNVCKELLGNLFNGLTLGEILGGACEICLNYHDERDFPKLQRLLSEQH